MGLFAALAVCQNAHRGLIHYYVTLIQTKRRTTQLYLKLLRSFTLFIVKLKHKVHKNRFQKVNFP